MDYSNFEFVVILLLFSWVIVLFALDIGVEFGINVMLIVVEMPSYLLFGDAILLVRGVKLFWVVCNKLEEIIDW